MIYYANPSTEQIRDTIADGRLGCIITPHQGNVSFPDEWDVIADNGCFSNRWTFQHWHDWLLGLHRGVRFAVCPDVFDPTGAPCHEATVERWREYGPMMQRHGFRAAFVCQVGATAETVPWECDAIFLGGTTSWKLGADASAIVAEARRRGVWAHMGRVNSQRRLTAARSMGCDSVDGTYLTFGPDVNLPRLLAWLDDATCRPMLWEGAA